MSLLEHTIPHLFVNFNRVNLLGCAIVPDGPLSGAAMSVLITSHGILSPSFVSESVVDVTFRVKDFISQRAGICCRDFRLSDLGGPFLARSTPDSFRHG
jgi:hypothetical protein